MPNVHTTLTSLFSAIANAIRGKTGSSAQIVADDFPDAIDAIPTGTPLPSLTNPASASDILNGKEAILPDANDQPVVVTGTYEPVYDAIDCAKTLNSFWQGNSNFSSNKITINALSATSLGSAFQSARFLPDTEITLNCPAATNMSRCFQWSYNLKKITLNIDYTKMRNYSYAFHVEENKLKEIDYLFDFSMISNANNVDDMFRTTGLETIRIVPNTISVIGRGMFSYSTAYTDATIISIANGLKDGVTGQTLTLHATPKARTLAIMGTVSQVTDNGVTYNFFTADEQGTTSLNAFITTIKGWTLA